MSFGMLRHENLDGKLWLWDVRECKAGKGGVDSTHIGQLTEETRWDVLLAGPGGWSGCNE